MSAVRPRRLLFVTDVCPFPFDRGQHVRIYNLIAACAQGFEVTFLGPAPKLEADRQSLSALCARIIDIGQTQYTSSSWKARVAALIAAPGIRKPSTVRSYLPFTQALQALNLDDYDCIWAERLHISRLFTGSVASRTVVDLDDLEHVKLARKLALKPAPMARLKLQYSHALYKRGELQGSRRFLAALVCSEDDRRHLAAQGCTNIAVVPNGTAIPNQLPVRPEIDSNTLKLVFLGNLGYPPNLDAVRYFVDEVLPLLRGRVDDIRFDVIGPGSETSAVDTLRDRVNFRGFVDDIGQAFAQYTVFVAPLRVGSGTKLKVLDAMSRRIAIVTTSIGTEGLDLVDDQHALVADGAKRFAEAILRLHADAGLRERLASNAHALVRNRYGWDAIRRDTARMLDDLLAPDERLNEALPSEPR